MIKSSFLAAALLMAGAGSLHAQSMKDLIHPAPDGASIGFVLTDGTVMVQGFNYGDWWRMTPDITGSYVKGTWKQAASLPAGYLPLYFASAVLADGRLLITGGEYNNGQFAFTRQGAVYDPVADKWTKLKPPAHWGFIGDSPSSMLPNGDFLLGRKFDKRIAVLDPATLTWTEMNYTGKRDENAEEGWTLMPDGNVLTADVKQAPNAEVYNPSAQAWTTTGATPVNLMGPPVVQKVNYGKNRVYYPPGEIGPAILRPDGTIFATGAMHVGASAGHTAIYTPGANGAIGTWAAGPDFQNGDDAGDSFAALLPTGTVLVESETGNLYEFDGTNLIRTKYATGGPLYDGMLLVLPTGEIFVGGVEIYSHPGTVNPAWAPAITSVANTLSPGSTYPISGTQFNGLSQANAFGDELETATNYPLVRITNVATGHVFYARTHGHSTMGVATGNATVSTNFDVPASIETGASTLVVVANGIPSAAVNVTVQ